MNRKHFAKYQKLGLNIAYYRRKKGLTQMQLAEMVNIDRTHMGRIETAVVSGSLDVIFDIADVLELPVSKLFEFRD